jgi:hypothetical protein
MKVRKIREITTIKFLSVNPSYTEYLNQSFEAILDNEGVITGFIDWLNGIGSESKPFIILDLDSVGIFKSYKGWDIVAFDDSIATKTEEIVTQLLREKLLIIYGELNYFYEDASDIGIPYIDKKSKDELDLIIRNEIIETPGVKEITTFSSKVQERLYILNFSVKTVEGEIIWLSVEV